MFSVVVPLYNKEKSISKTLNSVLNQTFSEFEVLVVNDGSTDGSLIKVREITDSRIRIINKENGGVSSARNLGIRQAKFKWIAFLDGDDFWDINFLSTASYTIKDDQNIDVFATGFAAVKNNSPIRIYTSDTDGFVKNYFESIKDGKYLIHSSALCVKKVIFKEVGLFREDLTRGEDREMWARLSKAGNIWMSTEILSYYNIGAENRAMNTSPALIKFWNYNLAVENITSQAEEQFYRKEILSAMTKSFRELRIKTFYKYRRRYKGFISFIDIIGFWNSLIWRKIMKTLRINK